MKKIVLFFSAILMFSQTSLSQTFSSTLGNEWIVYGQDYLKIAVDTKGIYRITKANLDAAGFDVVNKNVNNFQVFFRGNEIAVKLFDNNSNTFFDSDDYIEFYAINNDGALDVELYPVNHVRSNVYTSIYSNETAYFLTIGTSLGKRMPAGPSADINLVQEPYYMATLVNVPTQIEHSQDQNRTASSPLDQQTYFEPHEGLTGFPIAISSSFSLNVTLPNYEPSHGTNHTKVEGLLQSRQPRAKTLNVTIGGTLQGSVALDNRDTAPYSYDIPTLTSPLSVGVTWGPAPSSDDYFSVCYTKTTYPRQFSYLADTEYGLLENVGNKSRVNFAAGPTLGYDITDFSNQKQITIVGNDLYVANTNTKRSLYLASANRVPKGFKKIIFTKIVQTDYDSIILSDSSLRPAVDDYITYRKSPAGGNYKPVLKEFRSKYDPSLTEEFSYGERTPMAIRRFVDYMTNEGGKMKFLFLIGNSYSFTSGLKSAVRDPQDLVPTFGYPGSDVLLSAGLKGTSLHIPYVPTGRLVAISKAEVTGYLNKVIEFEAQTDFNWQKNIIHFTGAKHAGEPGSMKTKMDNLNIISDASPFGFNAATFFEKDETTELILDGQQDLSSTFMTAINNGSGLLTYLGHGNNNAMSHNLGFVSKPLGTTVGTGLDSVVAKPYGVLNAFLDINNINDGTRRYPFLFVNGCGVGNSFTSTRSCIVSNWVKTPDKGAIAAYSQSYFSYEDVDYKFMELFYNSYFGNQVNVLGANKVAKPDATNMLFGKPIGEVIQQIDKNYDVVHAANMLSDPRLAANLQQGILHADPAIVVFKSSPLLPIRLISFSGSNFENKVKLEWETESEFNFEGFEIERSNNLKSFKKIAFQAGKGSENEKSHYEYFDENPENGINYYRLKLIENDGSVSFSKLAIVNFTDEKANKLVIYENPINRDYISFKLNDLETQSVELFDLKGSKVDLHLIGSSVELYKFKFPSNIQKGEYILKAKDKLGKIFTQKVLLN